MITRTTLLSLLLLMPLTSHAGFTTGMIVGHVLTDKGGERSAPPGARSYDPKKVIDCYSYEPLNQKCKLNYKLTGKDEKRYNVKDLARKYLNIPNPKIKFIHEYEHDWLVEFE